MKPTFHRTLAIWALSLALVVAACTEFSQPTAAEAEPVATDIAQLHELNRHYLSQAAGGRETLVVALASAPLTLDPADYRDRVTETLLRNLFDGLVTRDTRSGIHMELAESMAWIDDTTLEIALRRGVTFHDGAEMTAEDVAFTFRRVIEDNAIDYPEPHTSPRKALIAPLDRIEMVDDYTVRMHFSGPWPVARQLLVHQQIVPKHTIEAVGIAGFVADPIGTGPFRFVSGQLDNQVVLARYDGYWGGAPALEPVGPACVQRVEFRIIPESSTRVAALLAGEVDIIQAVPPALIDILVETPGIEVKSAPSTLPTWMEMNVNRPPFGDLRVRLAMNYAVDKTSIVEGLYGGRAQVLAGPLSPFNSFADPSLTPYPYDPGLALELLATAGWQDSDDDGMLDRGGEPFSFVIDTISVSRPLAEEVAGQLRRLGIDASVRVWDYSVLRPLMLSGERLAYVEDWGDSAFDPVGHFEAKWHSQVEDQPYGRGNFSNYSNPRVDELIKAGETELDPASRKAIYDEAQQLIYAEVPAVFLVLPEVTEAASSRVQNWEPASDGRLNLHDVCLQAPRAPGSRSR